MTGGLAGAAAVAAIAIVPLIVLMLTSFVKISVVLSLVRNAIGALEAPSGLVVTGLSLILTFFVMAPVAIEMIHAGAAPSTTGPRTGAPAGAGTGAAGPATTGGSATTGTSRPAPAGAGTGEAGPATAGASTPALAGARPASAAAGPPAPPVSGAPGSGEVRALELERALRELVPAQLHGELDAATRAVEPLRRFLVRHAGPRDRATFAELATRMGRSVRGDELWVLAPAFLTTELREAFAIAVLIFVPFLVVDLLVGLGLAALGLTSTSPQAIALPLKLLLFVAVDGWRLLIEGLLRGYV